MLGIITPATRDDLWHKQINKINILESQIRTLLNLGVYRIIIGLDKDSSWEEGEILKRCKILKAPINPIRFETNNPYDMISELNYYIRKDEEHNIIRVSGDVFFHLDQTTYLGAICQYRTTPDIITGTHKPKNKQELYTIDNGYIGPIEKIEQYAWSQIEVYKARTWRTISKHAELMTKEKIVDVLSNKWIGFDDEYRTIINTLSQKRLELSFTEVQGITIINSLETLQIAERNDICVKDVSSPALRAKMANSSRKSCCKKVVKFSVSNVDKSTRKR